jgi:[ribosomal protein S5]-alanine N-acetyltransferase
VLRNRAFMKPFEPDRAELYFTPEGQRDETARAVADREADRGYAFGIYERGAGALAGRISLSSVIRGAWHNANVGYFVGEEWGGRGFATAAVRDVLRFAFGQGRLHRVQAAVMPRNAASIRVLERNGFRQEGLALRYLKINGVWEDHNVYAITREEW